MGVRAIVWAAVVGLQSLECSCKLLHRTKSTPDIVPPGGDGLSRALFGRAYKAESLNSYHSSDEIVAEIEKMKQSCSVRMETEWVADKDASENKLFVVKVGDPSSKKTVMVASNEHARELITAEVSLRFLKKACNAASSPAGGNFLQGGETTRATLLKNVRYVVLPVVNVAGRKLVEQGESTCQRYTTAQEGNVDLNRNADVDWGKGERQNWGTGPFSTYQARIMRDVANSTKPISYVDLHSGARSLMTSWGFKHEVDPDFPDQQKLLEKIKNAHCPDCRIGANSVTIGYDNPGEMIDHMYAKEGIKYSSLWEVWQGQDGSEPCIGYFNPFDAEYEKQVEGWSDALFTLGQHMHSEVNMYEHSHPGSFSSLLEDVDASDNRATKITAKSSNHFALKRMERKNTLTS